MAANALQNGVVNGENGAVNGNGKQDVEEITEGDYKEDITNEVKVKFLTRKKVRTHHHGLLNSYLIYRIFCH